MAEAKKREYIVDGFSFLSQEDAAAAREEMKKARYLKKHLDSQSAETVLLLYRKALADRTFQTPVGLTFVGELRDRLIEAGVDEFEIEPIPVYYDVVQNKMREGYEPVKDAEKEPEKPKEELNAGGKFRISLALNVFLALLVAGMFYVAMTGNNPNILNYESTIVNKYAAWGEELTAREQAVREKEKAAGIE